MITTPSRYLSFMRGYSTKSRNAHRPPYNNNFGNKIGGIYSHIFQDVCDEWVAQLHGLLPQLGAIAVTHDTTQVSAGNYQRDIRKAAQSINPAHPINPTPIDISTQSNAATIGTDLGHFVTNQGNGDCRTCALIVPMGH
jgi:hypothetical protein